MTLSTSISIDLFVVLICAVVIIAKGDARFSHPGILYLAFHFAVFSLRAIAIQGGAPTYFEVSREACARALNLADISLLFGTIGWLVGVLRRNSRDVKPLKETHDLEIRTIILVAIVAIPYGLYSMAKFTYIPGSANIEGAATTAYLTLSVTWPGLILTILIYRLGFRLMLVAPMTVYLIVMAFQGQSRFRVVLPLILLMAIYLDRRGKRWPGWVMTAGILAAFLLFFPLKTIGQELQDGVPPGQIAHTVRATLFTPLQGDSDGQGILDQLALSVALDDQAGKVFWGKPYLNVLVLPIPRSVWPEKPGLADHISEIQTRAQPIGQSGAVTTVVGDFYLNFRMYGVVLGSFLLAFAAARLYRRAYERPYNSIARFMYLVIAASSIQIARDGLISVPVFLLIQGFPYILIAAIRVIGPKSSIGDSERPGRHASDVEKRAYEANLIISASAKNR